MVYRTFPFRLYQILEKVSESDDGESCHISWTPCGTSFKIHDLERFKAKILTKYFPKQSKYKSFKRQLQYYGFVNFGSNHYGHVSFRRDQKSLLFQIEHRALKKTKIIISKKANQERLFFCSKLPASNAGRSSPTGVASMHFALNPCETQPSKLPESLSRALLTQECEQIRNRPYLLRLSAAEQVLNSQILVIRLALLQNAKIL
jgi:hypothetical protein